MSYLTKEEFDDMGFHEVADFDKLEKRAEIAINFYTQGIYQRYIDFEKEADYRKQAVKLAMAFQIAYLDTSGVMTADEKQTMSSVTIGRTRVDYSKQHSITAGQAFNLSLDAENALKQAGFSLIVGVGYDR
ncbi:hypothetical protein PNU26_01470 [Streptococcus salivarius]|jgi:phage protein|uniref:Phage protein n=1 Tax=Streptococcus salivarius TaxID=1304 RepID=A0AAW6D4B9_STRSL|nr:hypothetical protein [Streptococcus salivarius]MDB8613075.1 hypothetical protein [Streptococcus salivarius]DAV19264.1 MAG TPA: Putative Head Tail Connector Protein [Caudoviricetes sp.]